MKRLVGVLLLAALASGCSTPLTPTRLGPSFDEVFAGLYLHQQALIGRTDLTRSDLGAISSCQRSGSSTNGPGDDWICSVQYVDSGASAAQTFEVELKSDGCWKADGAPTSQPALITDPRSGRMITNPLAEFDGCLDTSIH